MKKITLATIKKFIRENKDNLYIRNITDFDGMVDCVMKCKNQEYRKTVFTPGSVYAPGSLGVTGAWFVGSSRDRFCRVENDRMNGFEIWNSCGSFELVVMK